MSTEALWPFRDVEMIDPPICSTERRAKPGLASVLGMALLSDDRREVPDDRALRELGITGRPVSAYVQQLVLEGDASSD